MATERVQVEISVVDEISNEIKAIRANLERQFDQIKTKTVESQNAFSNLGSEIKGNLIGSFKSLLSGFAAMASIGVAISYLKNATEAAREEAEIQNKLKAALGFTSTALLDQAKAISLKTKFDDDQIVSAQSLLANYVKSEEQLKRLTPAIINLAAATGQDLTTAAQQVARAIADDNGELGRYKIAIDGAKDSTQRIDSVINGVNAKFGGQAEAIAKSNLGAIQFDRALDDLAKTIGKTLIPALEDLSKTLTPIIKAIDKTIQFVAPGEEERLRRVNEALIKMRANMGPSQDGSFQSKIHALLNPEEAKRAALFDNLIGGVKSSITSEFVGPPSSLRTSPSGGSSKPAGATAKKLEDPTELFSSMRQLDVITEKLKPQNEALLGYMSLSTELMNTGIAADIEWAKSGEESSAKRVDAINKEIEAKKRSNLAMQTGFMLANQGMATLQDIAKASGANATTMKRLAQGQALINTAQGVTSILAHAGDAGFLSVPAAIAMSVMIGAQGLAQVAMIEKQKFALGGYARPGMALVGEYGPELVRFDRPGQVYNARETRQMVNSSTTNNSTNATFVFNNPDGSVDTLKAKVRTGELDGLIDDLRKRGGF
jgi:hypothetical protein